MPDWRSHQDFLQCLASSGILPAKSYSDSPVHRPCPLCDTSLARCGLCRTVMCLNRECTVSRLIPFQSCSQHVFSATCLPCLESETFMKRLAQCPQCELWFCDYELTWCLGRPKDLSKRSLGIDPHDIPRSAREHPAKPVRCFLCVGGQDPPRCANGDCWSIPVGRLRTSICDS